MTNRLAALAVIASLGCSTYQGSKTTAKVGGLVLLGGAVAEAVVVGVASQTSDNCCGLASPVVLLPLLPIGVGVYLGVAGLIGMAIHSGDDSPEPDPVPGRLAPPVDESDEPRPMPAQAPPPPADAGVPDAPR